MSVQVWVGEIPEHAQEREAIVALARGLARLDELYLILANFTVGGQAVDLAILKHNGGFVIELKHCDGKVIGGVNGKWQVVSPNDEVHIINPDRRNPYNQVISYFYRLSNFLNQHRADFLSEHRAASVDFRTCKRLVVIAPTIHPDSEIVLDWKVDLKGLDELPTYLVTTTSSEVDLTEEELLAIPRLLRCEPWRDVNILVSEGALEEGAAISREATSAAAEENTLAEGAAPARRPWPAWTRWVLRLGILGVILILLVAIGFLSGILPTPWGRPTPTLQPTATRIPLPPTPDHPTATPTPLVETVEQTIPRDSAFAGGQVEITLRTVEFQRDQLTLHWALVNHGTRAVRFPLTADNITIHDNIGNDYGIDEQSSIPRILVAEPEERVEGSCTVLRPVSPDAITLLVFVNGEPFEDRAVWPVNIPGRE